MQHLSTAAWVPVIGLSLFATANLANFPALVKDYTAQQMQLIGSIMSLICTDPDFLFLLVLTLRYYRLIVHLYAYLFLYKADEVPAHPTVTGDNVHVVISTVDPTNQAFTKCVQSILENKPRWLTIAVGGERHLPATNTALEILEPYHGSTKIQPISIPGNKGDKRQQMTMVLDRLATNREANKDTIVVFVDDHAWWGSNNFLAYLLAPFENPKVGLVGTIKRVQRERGDSFVVSILNFLACLYLERHNFDITAQNAIDGGAFVISARTCAVRASIVMEDKFRDGFMNEYFFFNQFGPLRPDDDNYITRSVVRAGWEIKFQNHPNSIMHTTLGVDGATLWNKIQKFHGQLLRWARSQWRSNSASLITDRSIWRKQWFWTAHAGLITSLISGALIWDPLILYAWSQSSFDSFTWYHILALIIGSKMIKLVNFFRRNPRDLKYFPLYVVFAWVHTFYKLWALVTFWDCGWAGRPADLVIDGETNDSKDDNHDGNGAKEANGRDAYQQPSASDSEWLKRFYNVQSQYEFSDGISTATSTLSGSIIPPGGFFNYASYQPVAKGPAAPSPTNTIFPRYPDALLQSASSSRSSSVSSTACITEKNITEYKPPFLSTKSTPWGPVTTGNPHLVPANVRESTNSSRYGTRSTSHSQTPARESKDPQTDTFKIPSYSSHALTTKTLHRSPTPSPSLSLHKASTLALRAQCPKLYKTRNLATPAISFTLPIDSHKSYHTRRPSEACLHINDTPQFPTRTNFTKAMPAPPSIDVQIVFKKDRTAFSMERDATGYDYRRNFVRGDDCRRVHGDGAYLTPRSGGTGSQRRCRSPGWGRY